MLICNTSWHPQRAAILADIAEGAFAADVPTSGTALDGFIDDPASIIDSVDAFVGEIMSEGANADDIISIGAIYNADILEDLTALDIMRDPGTIIDSVIEVASAQSSQDTVAAPVTWNPSDKSANIVLSSGNLTAAISAAGDNGVRATTSKTTGKLYFELTSDTSTTGNGFDTAIGIGTSAAILTSTGTNAANACLAYLDGGLVYYNGSSSGKTMGGSILAGQVICVAVDLVNRRIWMRISANAWFNDAAANPATNTNGLDISSLFTSNAAYPLVTIYSTTPHLTANFGATAFAQTMPSGFSAWQ